MRQDHVKHAAQLAPEGYRFLVQVPDNSMSLETVLAWATRVFGKKSPLALPGHFKGSNFRPSGWMVFCRK